MRSLDTLATQGSAMPVARSSCSMVFGRSPSIVREVPTRKTTGRVATSCAGSGARSIRRSPSSASARKRKQERKAFVARLTGALELEVDEGHLVDVEGGDEEHEDSERQALRQGRQARPGALLQVQRARQALADDQRGEARGPGEACMKRRVVDVPGGEHAPQEERD